VGGRGKKGGEGRASKGTLEFHRKEGGDRGLPVFSLGGWKERGEGEKKKEVPPAGGEGWGEKGGKGRKEVGGRELFLASPIRGK